MKQVMDWYYDEALARAGVGEYITEGGGYVGHITQALHRVSVKGTVGFEFEFKSNEGQKARYITVWVRNGNGELLPGYSIINSLMGLARAPAMSRERIGTNEDGSPLEGYPFLCGKPVGVILQKEHYTKGDGSPGYQFNVLHFVDATTLKTQTETLNGREAKEWYKPVPDKVRSGAAPSGGAAGRGAKVVGTAAVPQVGTAPAYYDNLPF